MNPMPILELTLQRKTDSGYPVIAALTRLGGFLPLRREGMLNLDPTALAELQFEPLAYGTTLGQALFVDEIRDTFVKALGDEPLRVLLSIESPDLRAIDWHRLAAPFDGRWRFLASQQNTPFSLSVPSPASAHFPALGRRDLRALLLVAGPESLSGDYKLAPFDVPVTIKSIKTALGDIPCDILPNPSLDALCAALTQTPYTILHMVCHGAVNQNDETILYFPKDSKRTPTTTTDLLNRLSSLARLPHFAFISACESALPQNGLGSLAGRLVRELGLPAVLAMTDRVSIATASTIAAPFYAYLHQHGQPDLALVQSLTGLQGAHDLTVPAIFSRLGDRPLFDENSERALTDNELEFGLDKIAESLPERAPVMEALCDSLTRRLRSTLGADVHSLSESSRTERKETLDQLNSLSLEAFDLSFNALCLGQTPPAHDSRSPFRGLESFRPEDAPYFFGREALTKKLSRKLNDHNFLAILGASGSGKSSLVMAGLIPALKVPYAIFRPGAEPLSELEKALQGNPAFLVVDQFEELFTLSAREQRSEFISRLLEQSQKIRVVITLRADFLGEVAPFKSLKDEVQNHQEIIPPMDVAELRRAMEGQAACAGLRFESDLSQQMLDEVSGEPGAMPLLQHALWTLWTRRHGRWLRAEEYRAFGGVKQAIASTAEAVFVCCTEFERERLRDIFLRLTRLDESADGRDTRRRVLLRDLIPADSDPESTKLLIKQLADARLVVVTGDEVEVTHEALIRHWERLHTWLNDDRDNLRLREGVSDDARRWENAEHDESLLNHRGPRLELALAMSKNPRYRLNPTEQAYLDGCVGLREREKVAAAKRRRYTIAGISVALVVIMAILAGWGWSSNENSKQLGYQVATADAAKATAIGEAKIRATAQTESEKQRNIAFARQLAAQAQLIFNKKNSKQLTSVLLAIRSMQIYPSYDAGMILQENTIARPIITFNKLDMDFVTFSPDGKLILTIGCDKFGKDSYGSSCNEYVATVWDITNGQQITQVIEKEGINSVAFSPDGKYIVMGGREGSVQVLETLTGKTTLQIKYNEHWISVAFDLSGEYIISGGCSDLDSLHNCAKSIARISIANTGKEVAQITIPGNFSPTLSPDRKYIAAQFCEQYSDPMVPPACTRGIASVWDASTGKEISHMIYASEVYALSFSPDGKYIVAGGCDAYNGNNYCTEGTARVWETTNGHEVARMKHDGGVYSVAFSPNGKLIVSGSGDDTARVWDAINGQEIARMTHDSSVWSVAFSPDGKKIISGSFDNSVRVWNASNGQELARMTHENYITSVAFSPDGKYFASSSRDGTAHIWGIAVNGQISHLPQSKYVTSVAFSPDQKYVAMAVCDDFWKTSYEAIVCTAATTRVLRFSDEKILATVSSHDGKVDSLIFSPSGKYFATGDDKNACVWDSVTGNKISCMVHEEYVTSIAFSADNKYVVSGGFDKFARVWGLNSGKEIMKLNFDSYVSSVAFSPDGEHIITGSYDDTLQVWEALTGKEIAKMTHNSPDPGSAEMWSINAVAFSKDGRYVVSGSDDKTARVWDIFTGKEISRMKHNGSIKAIAFSSDGKYVASGSTDGIAHIWDAFTGNEIARVLHDGSVISIAFSSDGKYVVSGSADGTARVWDTFTGQEIARITHAGTVHAVAFSPDGTYISSGSLDGTVRLWLWHPKDLIADACSRVTRNLTRSEWQQYIGDALPYQVVCPNLPIEPEPIATPTP